MPNETMNGVDADIEDIFEDLFELMYDDRNGYRVYQEFRKS